VAEGVVALDWLPVYPDRLQRPSTTAAWTFVQNLDPIPTPAPPTELIWLPAYPVQLHQAARVAAPPFQFRWPMVPVSDLRWLPRYPMQLRRPRLLPAAIPAWFGTLGVQQAIPIFASWRPTYPASLRRPAQGPRSQAVYPIQGSTILTAVACVEWTGETTTRPVLTPETFTRPQMTCQPGGGFLLLEDGGFLLLEDGGKILLEDQAGIPCETFVRPTLVEEDWC
jgi:hypothetical protein